MRTNVHIYPSPFRHESRILKETKSILDAGLADRVIILAKHQEGLAEEERLDDGRSVVRLPLFFARYPKNLLTETLMYFELLFRSVRVLRGMSVTHVNPHSLSVLPTGVVLKLIKRARLIYDAHELETERAGLTGARQLVSRVMERVLMPFVSKIVVVSPSIGDWYRDRYPSKPVFVIRNVPDTALQAKPDRAVLRNAIGVDDATIVLIYQGVLARGRGIEGMLKALSQTANPAVNGVFMGDGPLEPLVREYALREKSIHQLPPVRPSEVLAYTCGADIGMSMVDNSCLNHEYCLPNKFFEYVLSGLPVLVSTSVDQAAVIAEHGNGWFVAEGGDALQTFLDQLTAEDVRVKTERAELARTKFAWKTDAQQYPEIFS